MVEFCTERKVSLGYVSTKEPDDFGVMERELTTGQPLQVVKIPGPLACYWLGKSEIDAQPAAAGRREDFEKYLSAVPDVPPADRDRLD